jgi:hypothetical protein
LLQGFVVRFCYGFAARAVSVADIDDIRCHFMIAAVDYVANMPGAALLSSGCRRP